MPKAQFITTKPVHVICYDGYEYDRTATLWEIAKEKKKGTVKEDEYGVIFDFRNL